MSEPSRSTLAAAYEAAAYAVMSTSLGPRILAVRLTPGEKDGEWGYERNWDWSPPMDPPAPVLPPSIQEPILCSFAGQVARAKFLGSPPSLAFDEYGTDYVLGEYGEDEEVIAALMRSFSLMAQRWVEQEDTWTQVLAVAEVLTRAGELSSTQIHKISHDALQDLRGERE
jgi:hypothetical protein